MSVNNKTIVATTANPSSNYLYHPIPGDGSCFVNCYLEGCYAKYRNENSLYNKMKIARKFRLDFANFLMSESKKSPEKISSRLNILNPSIMCQMIKFRDPERSSASTLEEIMTTYDEREENAEENVFQCIYSNGFIDVGTQMELSYNDIKKLYETDHRINVSRAENLSTHGREPFDPSVYGVGKLPINIGFYELATSIGSSYEEIEECINTLCHKTAFLTHLESSLIARFFAINAIIFPLGTYYKNHYKLIEENPGAPQILMVNINNIHWNTVSFSNGVAEQLLLENIAEDTKNVIFSNLTILHSKGLI